MEQGVVYLRTTLLTLGILFRAIAMVMWALQASEAEFLREDNLPPLVDRKLLEAETFSYYRSGLCAVLALLRNRMCSVNGQRLLLFVAACL